MTQVKSNALFIVLSVGIHLLLLLILNRQQVKLPLATDEPAIISARLIRPRVIEIMPDAVVTERLAGGETNNLKVDDEHFSDADSKSAAREADEHKSDKDISNKSVKSPPQPKPEGTDVRPMPGARQLHTLSKKFIADKRQQFINDAINREQKNKYGVRRSMSELVEKPPEHQYTMIEQDIVERRKVKIYCDTTANKIASIASGLMGGTIECEKLPDLKQFIDARRLRIPAR